MDTSRRLRGIELRYALTLHLFTHGPATIAQLLDGLRHHGFEVADPAPKTVSDALRWERGRGRVFRRGWGRYGPGHMPRGTEYRIHQRVTALRAQAKQAPKSLEAGQPP